MISFVAYCYTTSFSPNKQAKTYCHAFAAVATTIENHYLSHNPAEKRKSPAVPGPAILLDGPVGMAVRNPKNFNGEQAPAGLPASASTIVITHGKTPRKAPPLLGADENGLPRLGSAYRHFFPHSLLRTTNYLLSANDTKRFCTCGLSPAGKPAHRPFGRPCGLLRRADGV